MRNRLAMLAKEQLKHLPESGCNSRQTTQINASRKPSVGAIPSEESEWALDPHLSGLNFVHRLEVLDEEEERLSGSLGCCLDRQSSVIAPSSRGAGGSSMSRSPYKPGLIHTLIDYEAKNSDVDIIMPAVESDKAAKMMLRRKQRAHNELFSSVGEELDSSKL